MSRRIQRINELVRREISEIIRRQLGISEFGVVTVTDVQISSDLKQGRIFVSVIGSAQQQSRVLRQLSKCRGEIQTELARHVIIKYTPHLEFVLDETGQRADRIMRILEELDAPNDPEKTGT